MPTSTRSYMMREKVKMRRDSKQEEKLMIGVIVEGLEGDGLSPKTCPNP